MRTQIFIVSYSKDAPWLEYCLRSINKFATGFSGTTVLVPKQDVGSMKPICDRHGASLETDNRAAPPLGFLDHMVQKCYADQWCPEADYILHTDSDCVFTELVTPDDYLVAGNKPVLLIEEFARLPQSHWKMATDNAMKLDCKFETMRRHPAVHYRDVYADLRAHISRVQGKPFRDYILSLKPDYPWGFSEFVALGQIALSEKWQTRYHFIDVARDDIPKHKLYQCWSNWGLDGRITDQGPHLGKTPREVFSGFGL